MADGPVIEGIDIHQQRAIWTKAGPVVTRLPEDEVHALEDRASASVGDATTLALWGFATGTWIAGTVIGGAFPLSYSIDLFPVLRVFAGVGQFIGGLFAFDRANTFAGTAFCSYGAFNVSVATYFLLQAHGVIPEAGASRVLLGFVLRASPTSRLC